MNPNAFILLAVLGALLLAGCVSTTTSATKPVLSELTVEELRQQLGKKDFFLVDVHIPEQAHIPGTDAFIPFDAIESRLGELPADKSAKIVLYCRTGRMSKIAGAKLASLGYNNVSYVTGGKTAWDQVFGKEDG